MILLLIILYNSVPTPDSISPTRHANGVDWQEEVYQEVRFSGM